MAAIAIPAFAKYMRRLRTAEARILLAKMFDSMANYHSENGRCLGGLKCDASSPPRSRSTATSAKAGAVSPVTPVPLGLDRKRGLVRAGLRDLDLGALPDQLALSGDFPGQHGRGLQSLFAATDRGAYLVGATQDAPRAHLDLAGRTVGRHAGVRG